MRVVKELVAINHVIKALEHAGYTVDMQHDHFPYGFYHENKHDLLCTDSTWVSIAWITDDGELMEQFIGRANCSAKDQFSPRDGAQIAFGRAMADMTAQTSRHHVKNLISQYEWDMEQEDDQ